MDNRAIAPRGWHVPSMYEIQILQGYLKYGYSPIYAGNKRPQISDLELKTQQSMFRSVSVDSVKIRQNTFSTDLAGGYYQDREVGFAFRYLDGIGEWWTSTVIRERIMDRTTPVTYDYYPERGLFNTGPSVWPKSGFSIRLIKNSAEYERGQQAREAFLNYYRLLRSKRLDEARSFQRDIDEQEFAVVKTLLTQGYNGIYLTFGTPEVLDIWPGIMINGKEAILIHANETSYFEHKGITSNPRTEQERLDKSIKQMEWSKFKLDMQMNAEDNIEIRSFANQNKIEVSGESYFLAYYNANTYSWKLSWSDDWTTEEKRVLDRLPKLRVD